MTSSDRPRVVVIGGANVDVKCCTLAAVIPATSNPGRVRWSAAAALTIDSDHTVSPRMSAAALDAALADHARPAHA